MAHTRGGDTTSKRERKQETSKNVRREGKREREKQENRVIFEIAQRNSEERKRTEIKVTGPLKRFGAL